MNLDPYIGHYIKVIKKDQNWFVGELVHIDTSDKAINFHFNIITSNNVSINRGMNILGIDQISKVEELDPKVKEGIKLTINNVPNIIDTYHSKSSESLPKRIQFGKIEESEEP